MLGRVIDIGFSLCRHSVGVVKRTGREIRRHSGSAKNQLIKRLGFLLDDKGFVYAFMLGLPALASMDYFLNLRTYIDINSYYYTFSTIAQSLASAFGFLAAVAVYRMQALERDVEVALDEVMRYFPVTPLTDYYKGLNRTHFWDGMENVFTEDRISQMRCSDDLKTHISTNLRVFTEGRQDLKTLRVEIVNALCLTSLCISLGFILISVNQLLKVSISHSSLGPFLALLALYCLLLLSCRCLWFYWDIAKEISKPRGRNIYASVGAEASCSMDLQSGVRHVDDPVNSTQPPPT
jgi:hypothetical protein